MKSFNSLSKRAKRKKIAEDALAQLKLKILEAKSSYGYFSSDISYYDNKYEEELQTVLKDKQINCIVCAMGALLVGDVINTDNLTVGEGDDIGRDQIVDKLSDYFPSDNLGLIETAFELGVIEDERYETITIEKAVKFGKRFKDVNNRLKAILNNIIESKDGLFHP